MSSLSDSQQARDDDDDAMTAYSPCGVIPSRSGSNGTDSVRVFYEDKRVSGSELEDAGLIRKRRITWDVCGVRRPGYEAGTV